MRTMFYGRRQFLFVNADIFENNLCIMGIQSDIAAFMVKHAGAHGNAVIDINSQHAAFDDHQQRIFLPGIRGQKRSTSTWQ